MLACTTLFYPEVKAAVSSLRGAVSDLEEIGVNEPKGRYQKNGAEKHYKGEPLTT